MERFSFLTRCVLENLVCAETIVFEELFIGYKRHEYVKELPCFCGELTPHYIRYYCERLYILYDCLLLFELVYFACFACS